MSIREFNDYEILASFFVIEVTTQTPVGIHNLSVVGTKGVISYVFQKFEDGHIKDLNKTSIESFLSDFEESLTMKTHTSASLRSMRQVGSKEGNTFIEVRGWGFAEKNFFPISVKELSGTTLASAKNAKVVFKDSW